MTSYPSASNTDFHLVLAFPPSLEDEQRASLLAALPGVRVTEALYLESSEQRTQRTHNNGRVDTWEGDEPLVTDALVEALSTANGLVMMDLPSNVAELAPNLQWVQSSGAGYDHVDLAELRKLPLAYCNASGIAAGPIAEFAMSRLLQVWKRLPEIDAQQEDRVWEATFGETVKGKTMGVVGLGAIGREVAKLARAFGMKVLATRGSAKPGDTDPDVDELWPASQVAEMLPSCDTVVVAAPATPETEGLFNADLIAAMPAGSVLCNVARGSLLVEPDLIAALESGHLRAAVLDVTTVEPLPAEDPLWAAPNCFISPHSAIAIDRYVPSLLELVEQNLGRLAAGEPLRNTIFDQREAAE